MKRLTDYIFNAQQYIDNSINDVRATYIPDASLSSDFYWLSGFLEVNASTAVSGSYYRTDYHFISTQDQSTFIIPEYTPGIIDVYYNGVHLNPSDYIAVDGSTIILTEGADAGALLDIVVPMAANAVQIFNIRESSLGQDFYWDTGYLEVSIGQSSRIITSYIATLGQTTFSATYTPGNVDVYYNGVRLNENEYTATSGSSIILNDGADAGALIDIVSFTIRAIDELRISSTPPATNIADGIKTVFTANEYQEFGDVCYIDSSGYTSLGNCSSINTANAISILIDNSISQGESGNYMTYGTIRKDSWTWTSGGKVYLSSQGTFGNTLTQIEPSLGVVQILGISIDTNKIMFNPQLI